jgi:hypothetical protein
MPRYFFHVRLGTELILDPEGLDLPEVALSAEDCRQIVETVLADHEFSDLMLADREVIIVDERGDTVLVVPFKETSLN